MSVLCILIRKREFDVQLLGRSDIDLVLIVQESVGDEILLVRIG